MRQTKFDWNMLLVVLAAVVTQQQGALGAFVIDYRNNPYGADKWPSHIVNYEIDKGFGQNETDNIFRAIDEFERRTCLRFRPVDTYEEAGIHFWRTQREVCRGTVGKQPYNNIYGYYRCWTKVGYILHEVMHNLGFRHEHQRPDRDDYVKIYTSNILDDHERFFVKDTSVGEMTMLGTDYDYYSVMHYQPWLFARPEFNYTMVATRPGVDASLIGQKQTLSAGDVQAINRLYCAHSARYRVW